MYLQGWEEVDVSTSQLPPCFRQANVDWKPTPPGMLRPEPPDELIMTKPILGPDGCVCGDAWRSTGASSTVGWQLSVEVMFQWFFFFHGFQWVFDGFSMVFNEWFSIVFVKGFCSMVFSDSSCINEVTIVI